jgi:hypothetical protein
MTKILNCLPRQSPYLGYPVFRPYKRWSDLGSTSVENIHRPHLDSRTKIIGSLSEEVKRW